MKNIVLFASGSGSNAQNIIEFFNKEKNATVAAVFCNNPKAMVIERCQKLGVPCIVFNREDFYQSNRIIELIQAFDAEAVVLAGFLWLVPESLVNAYTGRILNVHPALLPAYGGKGMYGMNVHEAVIAAQETKSGITIHTVDAEYDKGEIVFQEQVDITPDDTPESLAQKIHELEYKHFPKVIKEFLGVEEEL
jgi:phosphoribosylglycinamide formyltransferase 1